MKHRIFSLFIVLATFIHASAADNSTSTLDAVAAKLRTAPSLTASYTMNISSQGSSSGTLTISGNKFVMKSPAMSVWYDGTTQWTYIADDNEVSIDTPTQRELQQINPLMILNNFRQNFTSKTLSSNATTQKISLTAKNAKADIKSATVTINLKTQLPQDITLQFASGQSATIHINSLTIGKSLPADNFRFQKKAYPRASINDLR